MSDDDLTEWIDHLSGDNIMCLEELVYSYYIRQGGIELQQIV